MMWEYTGTAWMTYLGHEDGIADQQEQWQKVHDQDLGNGIVWGKPAPMNNTYAMAVRIGSRREARRHHQDVAAEGPCRPRT